jgi:predicted enzyme related to lactoylglutathione lyase
MTVQPEGTPCWVDAMFADLDGAKSFYADVLGWTFGQSAEEFGGYTQAYSDGRAVAGLVPPTPGEQVRPAWNLYLASPDVHVSATRVRDRGGEVLMEPAQVGELGSMLLARAPGGAGFGVWQAGAHEGFDRVGESGAYCWAEVFTRDPEADDAFLTSVFGYGTGRMKGMETDFALYRVGTDVVLGRMRMTDEFPAEAPSFLNVYFGVDDCDAAISRATGREAKVYYGPMDSPFGRFAMLGDPQGAAFSMIDTSRTTGEVPEMT